VKRGGPKRRRKPKAAIEAIPRRTFHEAAREQRVCAVPGCRERSFQAHHVVYEQHLKKVGEGPWSPRNALRLCPGCHAAHHSRTRPVPLKALTSANVLYAFEVLGPAAHTYLTRRYAGEDPRVEEALVEAERKEAADEAYITDLQRQRIEHLA